VTLIRSRSLNRSGTSSDPVSGTIRMLGIVSPPAPRPGAA
jgi:hypothetical protein